MPVSIEIIRDPSQFAALSPAWESLVIENPGTADGMDATTGYPWFAALTETFEQARQARIVVLREGGQVVGLLPLVVSGGKFCKRLTVATELYGGRNGFMLQRDDPALLAALLKGVGMAYGPWHSLAMMIVQGSRSDHLLRAAGPILGLKIISQPGWDSPYFPLLASHEQFMAGMSKSLKQTIRTSLNKFKAMGELRHVEIAQPLTPEALIEAILEVERASWKHQAGSAITRSPKQEAFYRSFFPQALSNGLLYGSILYLNDIPIAFNIGLLQAGVYSCLKHSNRHDQQALSPNQLLNAVLIEKLRARGVVTYDYMGKAEPHKLRWSVETGAYSRNPCWVFGSGPCGIIGYGVKRLKQALGRRRSTLDSGDADHLAEGQAA